jgi:signal transduction histidine kinase
LGNFGQLMDITLVFFIYGLAFFSMGLAMFFESTRSPLLADARVLLPLAIFGIVHGSHEWLEMFIDKSGWIVTAQPQFWAWTRIFLLTFSFISLLVFGLLMIQPMRLLQTSTDEQTWSKKQKLLRWGGLAFYVLVVFVAGFYLTSQESNRITQLDSSIRYALAVPAALLTGLALMRQATQARRQDLKPLSYSFGLAGFGFLIYGLTQCIVPPTNSFPANLLNTARFLEMAGFPIQVIRAGCAILVMVSLWVVIQVAEKERQRQFLAVQHERVAALEQVREELVKREAMRNELVRSIVRAQEDERARIARELHDETSQTLTAFSLHLAALRLMAESTPICEKLDLLQSLSRQMSLGLYRLVHDLRPAQLDDLGLSPALKYLASESQKRMGLEVDLTINGERQRLAPFVETVIFRVAQESLTNAARHSKAGKARLVVSYLPDQVHLWVEDEGVGFSPGKGSAAKSVGLAGMRERAELIGGNLTVESAPGKGTRVEMVVPLEKSEGLEVGKK